MKIRELLFKDFEGCTNGYCVITGRNGGMSTNGSCGCLHNLNRAQLSILKSRISSIAECELKKNEP